MEKTHKIRYIIGAGASANAIKTVADFPSLFKKWADFIKQYEVLPDGEFNTIVHDVLDYFHTEAFRTFSVDTLARLLWLRGDLTELIKLKTAISLILNLEQQQRIADKRYDVFLSSLISKIDKKLSFPKNIQIVSWNYDYQIEMVLAKISRKTITDLPLDKIFEASQFVKINGSVLCEESFSKNQDLPEGIADFLLDREPIIKKSYEIFKNPKKPLGNVKFSWEDSLDMKSLSSFSPDITVVIGYSFPTFNREVDMGLFRGKQKDGSHKVYIQCNAPNSKEGNLEVKSKLQGMGFKERQIQEVDSSAEFLVPFEFNFPKKPRATATLIGGNSRSGLNRM